MNAGSRHAVPPAAKAGLMEGDPAAMVASESSPQEGKLTELDHSADQDQQPPAADLEARQQEEAQAAQPAATAADEPMQQEEAQDPESAAAAAPDCGPVQQEEAWDPESAAAAAADCEPVEQSDGQDQQAAGAAEPMQQEPAQQQQEQQNLAQSALAPAAAMQQLGSSMQQASETDIATQVSGCLRHVLSLAAAKRANLHLLEGGTLAMAAGCAVLLLHMPSMQQRFLPGRDGGGVAAVVVHPNKQLLLVAEKCRSRAPNIYIYSYPGLMLQHTLPAGTERAYSAACFSPDGTKLAAVGGAPDYTLTLWDWAAGATLLRCKAFSQEVYGLGFCPHSLGHLVSCGTGHIRFWKMASTFTGLKLQGALGRFGAVELSDVAAWVELPDGKVLSGSEAGDLLLWEGGFIKAVISRPAGERCHDGPVEVLSHDADTNYLLSGGGDGLVRLWEVARIQEAEPPEGSNTVEVKPAVTVAMPGRDGGDGSSGSSWGVRGLLRLDSRSWLVQSEAGALFKVNVPLNILDQGGYSVSTLMQLQAGGVVGCSTCPDRHVLLTAACDGTISAIDYMSQSILQQRQFSSHISSMSMLTPAADPAQRCVVLGFADGCVRLVARCSDGWAVLAAARPHKVAVVCMAVSSDGSRLAAVAADGIVFFLQLQSNTAQEQEQQQLVPLLACQLGETSPSCCCWDAEGHKLLVGCSSGVAIEVSVPQPGTVDTSRSYHQRLPMRHFTVRLSHLRQQQQQPQVSATTADVTADTAAASTATNTGTSGSSSSSSSSTEPSGSPAEPVANNNATDQQPAATPEACQPQHQHQQPPQLDGCVPGEAPVEDDKEDHPVLPITRVAYQQGSSDECCLWLGGPASGQVLTCSWLTQTPSPVGSSIAVAGTTVSVTSSSWSGAYRLVGTADGQVRVEETRPAPRSWQCALHDLHDGRITGLVMAFDDSVLISGAADGTLLLLHNPLGPPAVAAAAAAPQDPNAGLPTVTGAAISAATSEASGVMLSLEEAKQATQRNQQAATAAAARQQLVGTVEALRQELEALMREDAARPPAERLPTEAFHLDQGLSALVQSEREARLAAAQSQVSFDAEVAARKLGKLQAYFNSTLCQHTVTVHPLAAADPNGAGGGRRSRSVSTLAPPELPQEVQVALAQAEAEEEEAARQQAAGTRSPGKLTRSSQSLNRGNRGSQRPSKSSFKARVSHDVLGPDASKAGSSSTTTTLLSRADAWRLAKKQRAAEWAAFKASRPDDTYDAPEDIAAVAQAAASIGDFKLKSDPGFMLPEEERWTPAKKWRQMQLLMRQMREARGSHNAQVLALRLRKRELVGRLNSMHTRLAVLDEQLGSTESLPQLAMLPEEEPEHQLMHVSEAQLAEHAAAQKAAADKAAGFGGLGGFAAASGGPSKAAAGSPKTGTQMKQQQQGSAAAKLRGSADGIMCSVRELSDPGRHRLQVERDQLHGSVLSLQTAFDATVAALRAAQQQLAVDLKAAEGRLLMMLKELALLKDAESKEVALEVKHAAKALEEDEMACCLAELDSQLADKRAEGEEAAGRRAGVIGELEVLLAEQEAAAAFKNALTKAFYRRIKRSKRHGPGSAASGGSSDDGGSDFGDDDGSGSDSSGSDSSGSEEVCPPGCDPALYDAVVELREHRLDEEEAAAEVSKALEALGKDRALLVKKAKLVDVSLAAINQEVLDFQVDKQARLNQLPATVSLRRHQLALESTAWPGDAAAAAGAAATAGLNALGVVGSGRNGAVSGATQEELAEALVFSSHALERLKLRMEELDQERDALKHRQKELRYQHKGMQEDKAFKEAKLSELTDHCTEVQMLKFGQVIDVGMLDSIGVRNKSADELREALKGQASSAVCELVDWDTRISAKRRELLGLLRENTSALTTVTDLTTAQRELEARVMAGRSELWQDPLSARRAAVAEQDRLVSRISSQAEQLEALRRQLGAMRRKNGAVHG